MLLLLEEQLLNYQLIMGLLQLLLLIQMRVVLLMLLLKPLLLLSLSSPSLLSSAQVAQAMPTGSPCQPHCSRVDAPLPRLSPAQHPQRPLCIDNESRAPLPATVLVASVARLL